MTTTVEQDAAISTLLSTDLATVADDRLIELCLLYRAAPSALPSFTDALQAEITRRFTAAEIANNDIMFSVINNFSNQFNPELQYKEKMYEFVNSLDRELWLSQNVTFFEQLLEIPERVNWVINSDVVISALVGSNAAMQLIVASSAAMVAIAKSSKTLSKIVMSATAREVFMSNNSPFQLQRQQIFNTISGAWAKQVGLSGLANNNVPATAVNNAVVSPQGFVFATLGFYVAGAQFECKHPNGVVARQAGTTSSPQSLVTVDVVSFNGAIFTGKIANATVWAELWIPPA